MSSEVWGDLAKSQTDPSTIDDEIDAKIQDHDDDPDAHLEAGQSLQSHKASEIIDHLARSIVRDKLSFDRFTIDEHFSTIDAWFTHGSALLTALAEVSLDTNPTTDDYVYFFSNPGDSQQDGGSFYNFPVWQSRVKVAQITNQEIMFGMLDPDVPFGIYFKIVDDTLYTAYVDDTDTEQLNEITGITIEDTWHDWRIDVQDAGSDNYNILYYIDNVLVYTASDVAVDHSQSYAYYRIKTTADEEKLMYIQNLHYDEEYTS